MIAVPRARRVASVALAGVLSALFVLLVPSTASAVPPTDVAVVSLGEGDYNYPGETYPLYLTITGTDVDTWEFHVDDDCTDNPDDWHAPDYWSSVEVNPGEWSLGEWLPGAVVCVAVRGTNVDGTTTSGFFGPITVADAPPPLPEESALTEAESAALLALAEAVPYVEALLALVLFTLVVTMVAGWRR